MGSSRLLVNISGLMFFAGLIILSWLAGGEGERELVARSVDRANHVPTRKTARDFFSQIFNVGVDGALVPFFTAGLRKVGISAALDVLDHDRMSVRQDPRRRLLISSLRAII